MAGHGNHYSVDLEDCSADDHPFRCESAAGVATTCQTIGADP